ncbi:MAG: substrate-binding domain-containing protein [Sphingobacteriales bacterium]|nr:substrate-binding domain-containing protein [Sphingobacteriales bacterium]
MTKNSTFYFLAIPIFAMMLFTACHQEDKKGNEVDHVTYGTTTMLADESLFPVVDDEYEIFANNYKNAKINLVYKPQQDLLKLFLDDSIQVAIMARKLTKEEAKFYEDRHVVIRSTKFAIDGIALITGQSSNDSTITVETLKAALSGKALQNKTFVFDNPKSSTVEYLMNLSGVKTFPKNIYALESNKEVIKYIIKHPEAIGIVSVAWLKRPTPDIEQDVEKVKEIAIKQPDGTFQKPTQSNLKLGNYALTRDLYLINCQGRAGLGTGFASFLAGELGQRIILKSGLAPDSLPSRQIKIRN